jgi:ADP-heptose:LPS heptosyltransferase
MLKKLLRKIGPNPLDTLLKRAQKERAKSFLLFWNRGLGDIALGLYAIVHRIKESVPDAEITFVTRKNLEDGFTLLGGVKVVVMEALKRGDKPALHMVMDVEGYDVVIDNPDPSQWVTWQRGALTPKLHWQEKWDALCEKYDLDPSAEYVGAHVQTETDYAHWRNWPLESWQELFKKLTADGKKVLLFGFSKDDQFPIEGVIDLRGETPLFDLLSIIKNRCSALVVPDSGISSMVYYLDVSFPIKHISLWADPFMGILKQNVASPNKQLQHIPILGKDKDIRNIRVEEVYGHLS